MVDKKLERNCTPYTLGIISIVLAFFQPVAGLILGIIGLNQSKKRKDKYSKKLNIWGIVLSVIVIVVYLGFTIYAYKMGLANVAMFP
jgi:hypothetical protein